MTGLAQAKTCEFKLLIDGSLVEYPILLNDSAPPLTLPIIGGLPSSNESIQLRVKLNDQTLKTKNYTFNNKQKAWIPKKSNELILVNDQNIDESYIYLELIRKGEVICTHQVEVLLRD